MKKKDSYNMRAKKHKSMFFYKIKENNQNTSVKFVIDSLISHEED